MGPMDMDVDSSELEAQLSRVGKQLEQQEQLAGQMLLDGLRGNIVDQVKDTGALGHAQSEVLELEQALKAMEAAHGESLKAEQEKVKELEGLLGEAQARVE